MLQNPEVSGNFIVKIIIIIINFRLKAQPVKPVHAQKRLQHNLFDYKI